MPIIHGLYESDHNPQVHEVLALHQVRSFKRKTNKLFSLKYLSELIQLCINKGLSEDSVGVSHSWKAWKKHPTLKMIIVEIVTKLNCSVEKSNKFIKMGEPTLWSLFINVGQKKQSQI